MDKENHLFIVWSKALHAADKIIKDIENNFEINSIYKVEWSKKKYAENLSRFYGEKLPDNSFKQKHCGTDEFLAIIVTDTQPEYSAIDIGNNRGELYVNKKVYNCKLKYRDWTGGGHRVHATNDQNEFWHDALLLLGKNELTHALNTNNKEPKYLKQDLLGSNGWSSFEELKDVLNILPSYAIMRGDFSDHLFDHKDDVDILTDNPVEMKYLLNAINKGKKYSILRHLINVKNNSIHVDINFTGDSNYDAKWQEKMLKNRILQDGVYRINDDDEKYSNMYHQLIHKNAQLALSDIIELKTYLRSNNYDVLEPKDITVGYTDKALPGSPTKSIKKKAFEKYNLVRKFIYDVRTKNR
ncbi:TPA: hypothetical protein NJ263_002851 [Vibrio parahaemolyticus]|nr:hypothetical protein [Vibrio parahaemolyticus]